MSISTLGPRNTNSEFATAHYMQSRNIEGEIVLSDTPEKAIVELIDGKVDKTVLCVVYPDLNNIVFRNLGKVHIEELFHFHTDNMVIARRRGDDSQGTRCCSHPAPTHLLPEGADSVTLVSSNSYAASLVAKGDFDICVTTLAAATEFELNVIKDYGPVPMGWAVFART
ncbi:hypothetical protein [Methylobacterium sp. SyP6R]|uniref:hypothetical protein n=1 Tax=Methylobacterium sp. SyP6R TaxID=2718876 RepID=UPI001F249928|nr:hypothetical protein [Methylobacterium sp. SyP6R]MCF4130035.1 hypothetical protein [Methylobacterium sp. SyP6R]